MLGPLPVTLLKYASQSARDALAAVLRESQFDTVQLESVHLLTYIDGIRAAPGGPKVVADWHNIESELMRRFGHNASNPAKKLVALRTASLLARAENQFLSACDAHAVVSEREKETLLNRRPDAQITLIPNGVEVGAFQAASAPEAAARGSILFVGSMDYHANIDAVVWFAKQIWPAISRHHPNLKFFIVGRNPPPAIRELASDSIVVTGVVADVGPYYRSALAAVVPLRVGGGTRLKILEAMAARVPIVSTSVGAEGLDAEPGKHLLLADSEEQLQLAIGRLLSDVSLRERLVSEASSLVHSKYDWSQLGHKLLQIHLGLSASIAH
jgi:glycosyltransferase involved in cell wall biosynthesis